jgi:hypothetical protein
VPLAWALLRRIGAAIKPVRTTEELLEAEATTAEWMREWFLTKQVQAAFRELDQDDWHAGIDAALVKACIAYGAPIIALHDNVWGPLLQRIFRDPDVLHALRVNRYRGRRFLRQEQLEQLLHLLLLTQTLARAPLGEDATDDLLEGWLCVEAVREAGADTGYDIDAMLDCLK